MQILFDNWTGRYDDECLMPGDIVEAAMVYNFRENAGNQTDTMIQMSEVADIVGNLPIYDTIYKENRYSPWKYAGQCYPGELQNRNPALMSMCYICSRYRADTREELEENIKVAKWAASKVVKERYRSHRTFTSHDLWMTPSPERDTSEWKQASV